MFYSYPPTENDDLLEKELKRFVLILPEDKRNMRPYVENENGVRIRRLTHYDKALQNWIIKKADQIYKKVMEL